MDKTRRSLIASAVAASTSPTALSVLGVNLFSQASHAADTLETSGTYTFYDSEAFYQIPKLVWVDNEPGPNGTFYTGWMGKLVPIDFLQIYRVPANNGAGFTGQMVHWQAYTRNGKRYRRGIVLAKVSFNTDGRGLLYATSTPDGITDVYTDVRQGGSLDYAEIRVKNCTNFSISRELWPADQVPYRGVSFVDGQLAFRETVSFSGYRRISFWAFRTPYGTPNRAPELFYRITMALPQANPDAPFRWYSRVVPADSTWATNTLLVAEGFMRQYAAASESRWGRATFALAMGGGVYTTYQASNHYAFQNIVPAQMAIGSAMLLGGFLFYTRLEATLWTTLASASSHGDRIAVHFTTQSSLDASNNLVRTLYAWDNSQMNATRLFLNTVDNLDTAVLWTGPAYTPIPVTTPSPTPSPTPASPNINPANFAGTCSNP